MSTHPSPAQLQDEKQIDVVSVLRDLVQRHDPEEAELLATVCDEVTALLCAAGIDQERASVLVDALRRLAAADVAENAAHATALARLREPACAFCAGVGVCDLCGWPQQRLHHDRRWYGGHGWRSVDFCHDDAGCETRRGMRAPAPVDGAA